MGGIDSKYRRIQGFDNWGGRRLLPGFSPAPPSFQVLPYTLVAKSETLEPGCLVEQSQGRPTSHWLDPFGRRAASEGSVDGS